MDGANISFLGIQPYIYGLFVSLGCLLGGMLLLWQNRRDVKSRNFAAWLCLLAPLLGLVLARLVWCLAEINFSPFLSLRNILNLKTGGFSMYGALAGACLAALIAGKLSGIRPAEALDRLMPALLLYIAVARLGEGYTSLGISRPLVSGVLDHTFLAVKDEYDAYLRTWLLEGVTALILCALALRSLRRRRPGGSFLMVALVYGVTQNLFESLRYDGHLRFSFIGLQQVLSVVLFSLTLIYLAVSLLRQRKGKSLAIASLILLPLTLGGMLYLEFMIDRSEQSKWLSYALYVALLCLPIWLGLRMLAIGGYNDQGQG